MVQLQQVVVGCYLWLGLGLGTSLALPEVLFRCPPCTTERLAACPQPPASSSSGPDSAACLELVREPGCGCCRVCARLEGETCGVYTPRCASGLRCYPRPGAELPLQALVQGQGTCAAEYGVASAEHRGTELPHPSDPQGTGGPGDGLWPGQGSGGTVHQGLREEALPGGVSLLDGPQDAAGGAVRQEDTEEPPEENHLDGGGVLVSGRIKPVKNGKEMAVIREKEIERQKQMGKLPKLPHHTELRPPTLRTPCQQELDQVLERISTMRLPDERGPLEHLYSLNIPNCDKQGLYNLKQCKMSVNGQRGECWCVNPNTGKVIQGAPTMRGDPQCHLFYTVHEQEDRGMQALSVQ
ncbi:insulin-like growth factor-binding protein 2 isoform X1 [Hemicordylus capensis]|uniref:insulin-like growth factor-binding protein 2 isoform X1 n=1 Tax=Hemicordylus capensis TaxID=884348 RepID=UPI0023023590|nr:insulin-like growth factor-binding protein 2 isoform X1 [Hemicordylus capensis]